MLFSRFFYLFAIKYFMGRIFLAVWIPILFLTPLSAFDDEVNPEEIIRKFAQKETEFKKLWEQYTYTQKVEFQVLSPSGAVRERRLMEIEVYFTTDGKRQTRVISDRGELRSVGVSKEDISDAVGLQPFVLTSDQLPEYKIEYKGEERVDELDTYVFEVEPRKIKKDKRYFKGRIWVDKIDFQIVMTRGKAVPDYRDNKFPEFETVREQIDGVHWFPTWTKADDTLSFGDLFNRREVHVRQFITYENYKKFEVGTTIRYGKVPEDE
ncbi:MAG TPA: hypothetical protein PLP42_07755 [Acidobacteriota bacterium]|nr:hypothetical protein [Acidobacteriota bacterium]